MSRTAVLFDLDGTLITRTQDIEAVYEQAFEQVGVEPFGDPPALWETLDGPPKPDDEVGYLAAGFTRLAAQHGRRDVDPLRLSEVFVAGIDNTQVSYRPDAEAVLRMAGSIGSVGIVTNGPRHRQEPKVDALSLQEYVDTIVYAGDLPRRKPHAEPFDRALTALGANAADALYVGDSLAYDIAGAHNAGLRTVWLSDGTDPDPYQPGWTIDSLAELSEQLTDERE